MGSEEDGLVAEATSAMHELHIQNPYTSDGPKLKKLDGEKHCTCDRPSGSMDGATNLCDYCLRSKCGTLDGAIVSELRQDSGTEDSSVSSDTPSDSSDTSDSSDSSASDSERESSENEDINRDKVVQPTK